MTSHTIVRLPSACPHCKVAIHEEHHEGCFVGFQMDLLQSHPGLAAAIDDRSAAAIERIFHATGDLEQRRRHAVEYVLGLIDDTRSIPTAANA